jgi:hypothetical protein
LASWFDLANGSFFGLFWNSTVGSALALSRADWAESTIAFAWASSPAGAPSALTPSISVWIVGIAVSVANFVSADWGGGPFGYFFLLNV